MRLIKFPAVQQRVQEMRDASRIIPARVALSPEAYRKRHQSPVARPTVER